MITNLPHVSPVLCMSWPEAKGCKGEVEEGKVVIGARCQVPVTLIS